MFASPINLVVDYLFLDIISAPTVDSLKLEQQDTALKKMARGMTSMKTEVVNAGRRAGRRISQASVDALGSLRKMSHSTRQTLTLPETTMEAHITASTSAIQLTELARKRNDSWRSRRATERSSSATFHKSITLAQKRKAEKDQFDHVDGTHNSHHPPSSSISASTRSAPTVSASSPSQYQHHGSGSIFLNPERSPKSQPQIAPSPSPINHPQHVVELFNELCVDLAEQRKYLNHVDQEQFDERWG